MSWDEAFASRYEEWSAHMTADVGFYVELARTADGPLVELGIGNGRVAISVAQATGQRVIGIDTRRRCSNKPALARPKREWSSTFTRATCATWPWMSRRR
jgi:tRNA G46 methylase TrmB